MKLDGAKDVYERFEEIGFACTHHLTKPSLRLAGRNTDGVNVYLRLTDCNRLMSIQSDHWFSLGVILPMQCSPFQVSINHITTVVEA